MGDANKEIKTVKDLIEILEKCDQDLPLAIHYSHTWIYQEHRKTHGPIRVALLKTDKGHHLLIGNIGRRAINPPNWFVVKELDGGECLPE